jgi:hypothetical protein
LCARAPGLTSGPRPGLAPGRRRDSRWGDPRWARVGVSQEIMGFTPGARSHSKARRPHKRPAVCDRSPSRSCIRERQQPRADYSYPCGWALAASVDACNSALLHSRTVRIALAFGQVAGSVYRAVVGRRAHCSWRGAGSARLRLPRRDHARAVARCRRPPSLTRHPGGVPRRPAAPQQGDALPRRPTHDPGDRHRDAPRR